MLGHGDHDQDDEDGVASSGVVVATALLAAVGAGRGLPAGPEVRRVAGVMSSAMTPTLIATNPTAVARSTATRSAGIGHRPSAREPSNAPIPSTSPASPVTPSREQATTATHRAHPRRSTSPGPPAPAQRRRPGQRAGSPPPQSPPVPSGDAAPLGEPASQGGGDGQPDQPGGGGRGRGRAVGGGLARPGSLAQQRQRPQGHQGTGRGAARATAVGASQHAGQLARGPGADDDADGRPREHRSRTAPADRAGQSRHQGRLLHPGQHGPRHGPSQPARPRFDLTIDTSSGVDPPQVIKAVRPLVAEQQP